MNTIVVLGHDIQTGLDGQMNVRHGVRQPPRRSNLNLALFVTIINKYPLNRGWSGYRGGNYGVNLGLVATKKWLREYIVCVLLCNPIVFVKTIYTVCRTTVICIGFWVIVRQPHLR